MENDVTTSNNRLGSGRKDRRETTAKSIMDENSFKKCREEGYKKKAFGAEMDGILKWNSD